MAYKRTEIEDDETKDIFSALERADESVTVLEQQNKQLFERVGSLQDQIKRLRRMQGESFTEKIERGRGFWPNRKMAEDFGDLLSLVAGRKEPIFYKDNKALVEGDNASGGYLVPEEMANFLIQQSNEYGVYQREATNITMNAERFRFPRVTDGVSVYSIGEAETLTASDMTFESLELNLRKIAGMTKFSSELSEDSIIGLSDVIGASFARAFAKKIDECGFVGTGADATYFGFVGVRHKLRAAASAIGDCKGLRVQDTPGAWSAIDIEDLLGVCALLPAKYDGPNTKWYCSRQFYLSVMVPAAMNTGGANAIEVINTAYTPRPHFFGRPVVFTSVMPTAKEDADHCPLLFGDMKSGCYLGMSSRLRIEQSPHVYFTSDQIAIRAIMRIDINNDLCAESDEAGPVVGLWADIA